MTEISLDAHRLTFSYDKHVMVTAGRASEALGHAIASQLSINPIKPGLKTFASGEVYCAFEDSVRGADLFIVQSLCSNPDTGISVNDALMELMLMTDAAIGASAQRVIAVMPWYGYSRQDKLSAPREPISARAVAKTLEAVGVDRVLTMDLHAGQLQGFFSKPVDHMTGLPLLSSYVAEHFDAEDLVIIAPDAGRVKLTRKFAQRVGAPYALMEKERPGHHEVKSGYVIGDVEGKIAIIVDDMIDTGGTLASAAQTVLDKGAREVYAVATHGLFSGNAFDTLTRSPLSGILVTDTVPLRSGAPDMIEVVSTAGVFAQTIRQIFSDRSVSEIFEGSNSAF